MLHVLYMLPWAVTLHFRFCIQQRIPPVSLKVNRYVVEAA